MLIGCSDPIQKPITPAVQREVRDQNMLLAMERHGAPPRKVGWDLRTRARGGCCGPVVSNAKPPVRRAYGLLTLVVLAFLCSRIPAISDPTELNVDESMSLAQVLRYTDDWVPWRAADSTSSGPVGSWYLMPFFAAGLPYGYSGVHVVAALTWAATLCGLFMACARWYGTAAAAGAALIAGAWLGLQQGDDFVHYSSETVPVLLISAALWLGSRGGRPVYPAAFLLGLVPWAKLQAAPIAAVAGLWLVAEVALGRRLFGASTGETNLGLRSLRLRNATMVCVAACLPTAFFVLLLWKTDTLGDFYASYIRGNLEYGGAMEVSGMLQRFGRMLTTGLGPWVLGVIAAASIALAISGSVARLRSLALPAAVLAAALFSILRSPYSFPHYQLLLVPPLALTTAAILATLADLRGDEKLCIRVAGVAAGFTLLGGLGLAADQVRIRLAKPDQASEEQQVVTWIRGELRAEGSIAIWGWKPGIFVADRRPSATRHAIAHFLFSNSEPAAQLRRSFMADIQSAPPEIVLDSSACWRERAFQAPPLQDFEALFAFVSANYTQAGTIKASDGTIVVYRRK